jgi:exopolysaccharide biosynthesis polyprenyl glycosylphosphotransferase
MKSGSGGNEADPILSEDAHHELKTVRNLKLTLTERKAILCLGDFFVACLAGFFALSLWNLTRPESFLSDLDAFWGRIPFTSTLWILLMWAFDLYTPGLTTKIQQVMQRFLGVSLVSLSIYLLLFFFAPRDVLPRLPILYFVVIAFVAGVIWRAKWAASVLSNAFQQRLLIIGGGWGGRALAQAVLDRKLADFEIVGFVDDDLDRQRSKVLGFPVLGPIKNTLEIAKQHQVNTIVYSITHQLRAETFQVLLNCQSSGIPIIQMPALYEALTERVPVQHVANDWLLPTGLAGGQISLSYRTFVSIIDHVFCLLGAIILVVFGPLLAVLIKLDSPGPVFYVQTRLGQGGRLFKLVKFRSMVVNAEGNNGAQWATEDDPRITRVGKVLRRMRLDELPQIVNILRGDLHLIGPRPERPEFYAQLEEEIPFYSVRLAVKPGLTGWAQIKYRYGSNVQETLVKLQYDLYYIKNRSPLLDLKILLRTVWKILSYSGT